MKVMFLNVTVHIGIFALGENSTLHKILLFLKQYICNFCLYHKSADHSWRHSRRVTRNKVRKRKRERKREGEREGRRLVVEGHRLDSNPRPLQWRHSLCTYCKAHATPTYATGEPRELSMSETSSHSVPKLKHYTFMSDVRSLLHHISP